MRRLTFVTTHPNESVGAPPLPGNSRSFSERREGHYKSANDFPEDPPDSSSSDSVTRSVRPRLGTRSTPSKSPEQADQPGGALVNCLTPTQVMTSPLLWSTEMSLTTKIATERHRKKGAQ
jgi:hypothetical protein